MASEPENAPPLPAEMSFGAVYVSFAQPDCAVAERLRRGLEEFGCTAWYDASLLRPDGLPAWQEPAERRIGQQCCAFVSIVSRHSEALPQDVCHQERRWAAQRFEQGDAPRNFYQKVIVDDETELVFGEPEAVRDLPGVRLPGGEVTREFGERLRGLQEAFLAREVSIPTPAHAPFVPPAARPPEPEPAAPSSAAPDPAEEVFEDRYPEAYPLEPADEEDKKPLIHDDNVQFTVYRPKELVAGKWHTLLAFAHLSERRDDAAPDDPDPVEEVERQARRILGDTAGYKELTQDSSQAIPREGEITLVPRVEDVEFNPPRRSFLWEETVHREEFRLRVRAGAHAPKTLRGRMTVFLGSLIVADIPLTFALATADAAAMRGEMRKDQSRPYRRIFASYSHRDLVIVEHIERYARAIGDRYLRDAVDLRAGEEWNPRLLGMIEEADVFQLFWSTNSMRSRYVRQEWEYALSLGRREFVRPTYWEDPMPKMEGLPPPELRRFHFEKIASTGAGWTARLTDTGPLAPPPPDDRPVLAEVPPLPQEDDAPAPAMAWSPPPEPVGSAYSGGREERAARSPAPRSSGSGGGPAWLVVAIVIAVLAAMVAGVWWILHR